MFISLYMTLKTAFDCNQLLSAELRKQQVGAEIYCSLLWSGDGQGGGGVTNFS